MTCRASFATALLLLMTAGLSTAVASPIEIVFNNTASPGVPFRDRVVARLETKSRSAALLAALSTCLG